ACGALLEPHHAVALPVQADEVEPVRRFVDPRPHVLRGQSRPRGERRARAQREQEDGKTKALHGRRLLRKQRPRRASSSQIQFLQVKAPLLRVFFIAIAAALVVCATASATTSKPRVLAAKFDNDVNPVTQDYINDQIKRANSEHYDAIVILLDTPGGLSTAMNKIVKAELASKVPVIVYVSPRGSRAASAGVWISEASDLLAMAPNTNIGSSTPIDVGGGNIQSDLRRKVVNDAAASLIALASTHHRNAVWAGQA